MTTMKMLCSLGLAVGVAGAGCWRYAQSHCGNHDGDETCKMRDAGTYCDLCVGFNDGCTDQVPSEGCLFVGEGMGLSGTEEHSTTGTTNEGGSMGGSTAGGVMSLDGEMSAEATTLEASDGGDATTQTSEDPPCVSNDQCSGTTPICDMEDGACMACSEHTQCGEAACNFFTGACLSVRIVHVGPGQMYTRLEDAVASFAPETTLEGTIIVHDNKDRRGAQTRYRDTVKIDNGRVLGFLAFEDDLPVWDNDEGGTEPLTVRGASTTALLDGITVTGSAERGLRVDGMSRVWVDRTRIIGNNRGIVVNNAEILLRNCFVGGDGESNALRIVNGTATVLYSTLAARAWDATALSCTNPVDVDVRNSIIVALGDPSVNAVDVDCSGDAVDITYTATESLVPGATNEAVGQIPVLNPSVWFADYANEDFHLHNDGLGTFSNIAQWRTGDPRTDIDGHPRPALDGSPDHVGADRP